MLGNGLPRFGGNDASGLPGGSIGAGKDFDLHESTSRPDRAFPVCTRLTAGFLHMAAELVAHRR